MASHGAYFPLVGEVRFFNQESFDPGEALSMGGDPDKILFGGPKMIPQVKTYSEGLCSQGKR